MFLLFSWFLGLLAPSHSPSSLLFHTGNGMHLCRHDCEPGGDPTQYQANLLSILMKANALASKTIFITTTPFHEYKEYSYPCVLAYNELAKQTVRLVSFLLFDLQFVSFTRLRDR